MLGQRREWDREGGKNAKVVAETGTVLHGYASAGWSGRVFSVCSSVWAMRPLFFGGKVMLADDAQIQTRVSSQDQWHRDDT